VPTLNWIGKKAVENHHRQVPFRLLKDVPELSVGDPGTGNLIVEGDNLLALKALLPYYAGQIKCIYIDPPYNIGNENWVYNDNVNSPEIRAWLGKVVGNEEEDLTRHDKWLCMMLPRLSLLHKMLREDGAIFVSIDDHEIHHLRLLMDEVFGAQNYIAEIIWEGTSKNDSKLVSISHDYILCYAKNRQKLKAAKAIWRMGKEGIEEIFEKVEQLRKEFGSDSGKINAALQEWYSEIGKKHPSWAHRHYKQVDSKGVYFAGDISAESGRTRAPYDVVHPVTHKPCKRPLRGWPTKTTMDKLIAENRVEWGENESTVPKLKVYLAETDEVVISSVIYKDRRAAMKRLRQIMGTDVFENPKDEEVLQKIFEATTGPDDLIMDSFGGSGTTAHAVLKLNKEENTKRRFVLCEMDPNIAQAITSERNKRIINGYKNLKGEVVEGIGGGFRYCQLGEPLFDEKGNIRSTVKFHDLARHVFFTETGEPLPKGAKAASPLIGVYNGTGVYLLYNGILKDKAPEGGNVLTAVILAHLPKHAGPKVIYGTACRIGQSRLNQENITFKQLPYRLKVDAL
jgi:adenine-specific DNA-methyltransferase